LKRTLPSVDELPPPISRFGFVLLSSGICRKKKSKAMRNQNHESSEYKNKSVLTA
jgi:hypothetical protein